MNRLFASRFLLWRKLVTVGAQRAGSTSEQRGNEFLTIPHPPAPSPLCRAGEQCGSQQFVKSPLQALGRGLRGGVRKNQPKAAPHRGVLAVRPYTLPALLI